MACLEEKSKSSSDKATGEVIYKRKNSFGFSVCLFVCLEVPRGKSRVLGWLGVTVRRVGDVAVGEVVGVATAVCVSVGVAIGLWYGHLRVATVVLLAVCRAIWCSHWTTLLQHLHLGLLGLVVLGARGGEEVDEEAGDVEAVDVRNGPLKDSSDVPNSLLRADAECDGQADFGDDEKQLDPEGDSQDGMLAVMDTQALVLPAYENSTDNVAYNKDSQENVVQRSIVFAIEDGE